MALVFGVRRRCEGETCCVSGMNLANVADMFEMSCVKERRQLVKAEILYIFEFQSEETCKSRYHVDNRRNMYGEV